MDVGSKIELLAKTIITSASLPSLEEFITGKTTNSYIKFKTIKSYYRKGPKSIEGKYYNNILTRANTTNSRRSDNVTINPRKKSTGLYRELDQVTLELAKKYKFDGIYIESVLNEFLGKKLLEYGYKKVNASYGTDNYFKELKYD